MRLPILLLALALACSAQAANIAGERFSWPVLAVKDGDTLAVALPGLPAALNPVAIRVRGIDTPETGGRAKCAAERKLASRATDFTRDAVRHGRQVEFAAPSWDKYGGRIDADVWIDGTSLARQLIDAGLARAYDGGKRRGWC
ncbi:MAG: thermonuclease family protein [Rhodospirillaceae bacterium]|nr:thermonuclease family protein [Rhodospirillaceae bacterium]